jgi:hypothetical protein
MAVDPPVTRHHHCEYRMIQRTPITGVMLNRIHQSWPILFRGTRYLPMTHPGGIGRMHPAACSGMSRMVDKYWKHPELPAEAQECRTIDSELLAKAARFVMHDAANTPCLNGSFAARLSAAPSTDARTGANGTGCLSLPG